MLKIVAITHGKKEEPSGTPQKTMSWWGIRAGLSAEGIETAKKVAQKLKSMGLHCAIFGCSPLLRAQQTAFAIMAELGIPEADYADYIKYDQGFWTWHPKVWYQDCDPADYNNELIYDLRPDEVEQEGQALLTAVEEFAIVAGVAKKDTALVVTHGGPLDAAIMVAKSRFGLYPPITNLMEGDGAIFTFDGANLVAVEDFLQAIEWETVQGN